MTPRQVVRRLGRSACEALLARGYVGRLAYVDRGRVEIEPLHYTYRDGWIYGRTTPGSKLLALGHRPWVAFETDEIEGLLTWRSVVAHGTFYVLDDDSPAVLQGAGDVALDAVREVLPEALTPDDPAPFRSILFRISVDALAGRESRAEE